MEPKTVETGVPYHNVQPHRFTCLRFQISACKLDCMFDAVNVNQFTL